MILVLHVERAYELQETSRSFAAILGQEIFQFNCIILNIVSSVKADMCFLKFIDGIVWF